ncbi:hypothetical protein VNO80_11899 [Phaseolus coccineus]|uniref:Uncharacterized protein n=1 Tax=Phaseolus coccineus TaxID=3886 RepID=A0AAN9NG38_PHACN
MDGITGFCSMASRTQREFGIPVCGLLLFHFWVTQKKTLVCEGVCCHCSLLQSCNILADSAFQMAFGC